MGSKKSQITAEVIKYALVGFVSVIVLIFGYKMVDAVRQRACNTELAKFEIGIF